MSTTKILKFSLLKLPLVKLSLALFLATLLSSCSFFSSVTSTSLSLASLIEENEGERAQNNLRSQQVEVGFWSNWQKIPDSSGENSFIYRNTANDSMPIYLTSIEECNETKLSKRRSAGISRKLFVGLKEIRMLKRESFDLNDKKIYHNKVTAQFENTPLHFSHYMNSNNGCIYDVVLWQEYSKENDKLTLLTLEQIETLFSHLKNSKSNS